MSDFLSEVDRHTLNKIARAIPGMISDPAERENVQILYDLLRQHVEWVAALESVLRELVEPRRYIYPGYMKLPYSGGLQCPYCDSFMSDEYHQGIASETHAPDCPVAVARKLLESGQ